MIGRNIGALTDDGSEKRQPAFYRYHDTTVTIDDRSPTGPLSFIRAPMTKDGTSGSISS